MKLYYSPGACSLSPHIVACEGGLPVELSKVTFSAEGRTTEDGEDFYEVNPRGGYVPACRLDDGDVLIEGPAIIQYLADQAPGKKLMPERGAKAYYEMLSWITFVSTELHKGFGPLFNPNLLEGQKTAAIDRLKKRYAYVDASLAGKDYLLGRDFSIADAYCYTIMRWSPRAGIALADYPNIAALMKRMEARAGVKKALEEEGLEPVTPD
ncbi:MAG TPA: glutathione transferase GstA [Candidatus Paceibacterota bacterium]|nr:glutathione transferase GstA [Candidatus Paceibacterota bacterium]